MSTQNDLINYQNVIKEANSLINEQIKLWGGVVSSIQQIGKVTPSSFVNAQKQVNETLQKSVDIQTKLDAVEKKRQATVRQTLATGSSLYKQQQTEIAQQERKRIALERATAKALEQNRAYNKLQTSWRNAQKALQDSIVTDGLKAQSTRKLQKEFNDLDKRIKQVDAATKNYSKNVGNYKSAMGGLGSLTSQLAGALGWAGALYTAVNIGKSFYDTTKQLDVLNKSMQLGSKDATAYASNIQFLKKITEDYGLELITTSQAYNKFYIASKNKLALEDIQLIFDKISKSASLMGLSVYDQEGIFKALEQMMSKGTVQAEELRGQLADRLPSAFEIMAKAMNVSTAELDKMMKDGKVMASEVLPKFAIELEKAFGADKVQNVDNLTAAENRLKNSWTNFISEINGSENAIGNFAKEWIKGATIILDWITRISSSWERLNEIAGLKGKTTGFNKVMDNKDNISQEEAIKKAYEEEVLLRDLNKKYKELNKEKEELSNKFVAYPLINSMFNRTPTDVSKEMEKVAESIGEVNGRMLAYRNIANGIKNPVIGNPIAGETDEQRKAREKAEQEALKRQKELTQAEYELTKVKLERQKSEAKYAEDMETYFAKELELANLDYQYKKKLTKLQIDDKERLAVELDKLQEEYVFKVEEIGRAEIANQEEVFKKISDAIKKFYEFKKKAREEDEKKRQEDLTNEYDLKSVQNDIDLESLGSNRGEKYWETRQKEIEDWYKYQQELHRNNAQELARIDKEYELQNLQLLNDRKNAFKQSMTEMYSSALGEMGAGSLAQFFNGQFEEIFAGAETLQEKMAAVMMAIGQIANDVFASMSESQNAYYEQQFKNLETEKDLALQFAGDNTAGREAIERQYDEKKRALQMEQARREKRMAIAQANINIAMGITSALAQAPPYSFILAALVGVLGAVQLATIASTPLPQFYAGTSNAPEGLALTQERGAEMITDKHGNIKTLGNNKGAQLTYLNKGDKVFTADETTQKLNELLISSGVSPIVNVSGGSGMSKEDMREVLNDTLAKQPKNSITFDENGIKAFTSKENRRTILKNRNVRI